MRTSPTSSLIEHLRLTVHPPDGAGVGDGELVGRFVERHDEAAFAALVNRHGPMVWGVCRRLLNRHDAEDAFQATFLILARKAASIRSRETAGNWLYGVAHQTALHARRTAARRRAKEVQVTTMPDTEAVEPDPWADLQPLLDEELSRLPDIYRTVIVLCDLEGRTRKEVALRLGVPEGTVAGRIARARTLLAKRLTRRGVALSGGALASVLTQRGASAGVPKSVVVSTIKAASFVAAGKAAGTGAVWVEVADLTEGVMKAMLFNKLKATMAVVLMLGFVATGATLFTYRTAAGQDEKKPVAEKSVNEGDARSLNLPATIEKVKLTVDQAKKLLPQAAGISNTDFKALQEDPRPETVKSKSLSLVLLALKPPEKNPVASKEFRLFEDKPRPVSDVLEAMWISKDKGYASFIQPKYIIDCTCDSTADRAEGVVTFKSELFAGRISFVAHATKDGWVITEFRLPQYKTSVVLGKNGVWVQEALKGTAAGPDEKKPNEEAFTAWGKKVGRLQAGLGFRPGEKRAYQPGETVTFVLRVRNPGDESDGIPQAVEFKHIWAFFVENPPTITDADGKPLRLPRFAAEGLQQPRTTAVSPGKEVELYVWKFDLRSKGEGGSGTAIHGTGKFSLQCERIVGPTSGNPTHPNPTLDKLATGKLELEVRSDPSPAAADKK